MVCIVEYIWIDGDYNLRSKTRVVDTFDIKTVEEVEDWNYDGSSTNQSSTENSDVILKPCALFKDPFRRKYDKLVLCDTYTSDNKPLQTNNRYYAQTIFNHDEDANDPFFGLEQEYFIINPQTGLPLGYHSDCKQGQYYCSIGYWNSFGQTIAEEHLQACIKAGITISGINAEVAPGQWEFQIGPCVGIDQGDNMWIARYLLIKIAEQNKMDISFEPKFLENLNGSGCHVNFSTHNMRYGTESNNGIDYINEAIEKLEEKHTEHMKIYGENNDKRMLGIHETADFNTFTSGVCDRTASVRIGADTIKNKKGYFEDRRPSSNCDPYLVTAKIFETCCFNE